jgi:hypothetical protein
VEGSLVLTASPRPWTHEGEFVPDPTHLLDHCRAAFDPFAVPAFTQSVGDIQPRVCRRIRLRCALIPCGRTP